MRGQATSSGFIKFRRSGDARFGDVFPRSLEGLGVVKLAQEAARVQREEIREAGGGFFVDVQRSTLGDGSIRVTTCVPPSTLSF